MIIADPLGAMKKMIKELSLSLTLSVLRYTMAIVSDSDVLSD
jgi:hypothetical protein